MDELYLQVVALLGKSVASPEFNRFISLHPASNTYDADSSTIYDFYQLGVGLAYDNQLGRFWMASFEFATKAVKDGFVKPFGGALLEGIEMSDRPDDVQRKIGSQPTKTVNLPNSRYKAVYALATHSLECLFEKSDGPLQGLTVRLL